MKPGAQLAKTPRGVPSVTDRMRAAHRMIRLEQTATTTDVAALYGVRRETVSKWLLDVEQAIADERRLAVGGGR